MKVFKDVITNDEMFTDAFKFEDIEDAFYMVIGKHTTVSGDNIQLDGANPSAEDGEEDFGGDSEATSGIDVVLHMRLQETAFGQKKEFVTYFKGYLKSLKEKLADEPDTIAKLPALQKPIGPILKNFDQLQFFTGESGDPDGMVVILDYKDVDGEEKPVLYFPKYGLVEEKL